jgi:N-acetylneuraminic acid mutarotase
MGALLAIFLTVSGASTDVCRWKSDSAFVSLTISPSAGDKYSIKAHRLPLELWFDDNSGSDPPAPAHVLVPAPIRFEATHPAGEFEFRNPRREIIENVVSAAPDRPIAVRAREGTNVIADVDLGDDRDGRVKAIGVRLPCEGVSLSPLDSYEVPSTAAPILFGPAKWMLRSRTLTLRTSTTERSGVVIQTADPLNLPLGELAVHGDWIRVGWSFSNHSSVEGWARRSDLVRWPKGPGIGNPLGGRRAQSSPCPKPAWTYRGRVRIAPGTPVWSRPGGAVWGSIVADRPIEVSLGTDPDWAKITYVEGFYRKEDRSGPEPGPGCDDDLDFAWIRRGAITMLPPAPPLESVGATLSNGAPMITPRRQHSATLLRDGRVAAIGGELRDVRVPTLELYDPKANKWSSGPRMKTARAGHSATLLRNGTVLVLGGCDDPRGEIFDPVKNLWHWTRTSGWPWKGHTATLLGDGTVLVVGDEVDRKIPSYRAAIYDPAHDDWRDAGRLEQSRNRHTATRLADGRVLIAGGFWTGTGSSMYEGRDAASEIYDPVAGHWSREAPLPGAREGHAATLLPDGRVLATGGLIDTGMDYCQITGDALAFDPRTLSWAKTGTVDPEANRFARAHVRPDSDPAVRRLNHDMVALSDGRVLLFGGDDGEEPQEKPPHASTRIVQYDPATDLWTFAGDLGTPRALHTTTLLPDGTILIVGGETAHYFAATAQAEAHGGRTYSRGRKVPDGAVLRYRPPPRP